MKLNLLLLSTIFLLLGMTNISYNNSINVEYSPICSVGITNDYDTGTFYQIEPGIDDQFIETYDAGEMRLLTLKVNVLFQEILLKATHMLQINLF